MHLRSYRSGFDYAMIIVVAYRNLLIVISQRDIFWETLSCTDAISVRRYGTAVFIEYMYIAGILLYKPHLLLLFTNVYDLELKQSRLCQRAQFLFSILDSRVCTGDIIRFVRECQDSPIYHCRSVKECVEKGNQFVTWISCSSSHLFCGYLE